MTCGSSELMINAFCTVSNVLFDQVLVCIIKKSALYHQEAAYLDLCSSSNSHWSFHCVVRMACLPFVFADCVTQAHVYRGVISMTNL